MALNRCEAFTQSTGAGEKVDHRIFSQSDGKGAIAVSCCHGDISIITAIGRAPSEDSRRGQGMSLHSKRHVLFERQCASESGPGAPSVGMSRGWMRDTW